MEKLELFSGSQLKEEKSRVFLNKTKLLVEGPSIAFSPSITGNDYLVYLPGIILEQKKAPVEIQRGLINLNGGIVLF